MNRFRWLLLLTVIAPISVALLLSQFTAGGGSTFHSPDGRFRLTTWSKLSDQPGGKYTVELFAVNASRPIRSVTVRVASNERTPVMRDHCDAHWDLTLGTVDLIVDGRPELRLHFTPDKIAETSSGG